MRFLADECVARPVVLWLREQGHDVRSIMEESPSLDDRSVLARSVDDDRVLITADKDFGDRVFRHNERHAGVVLLRLASERAPNQIAVLSKVIDEYGDDLSGAFVVATDRSRTVRLLRPDLPST